MGNIEKWLPIIKDDLVNHNIPLPTQLISAVIRTESGGNAGIVNPSSGASGLMQIMPVTLTSFNNRNNTNYTLSDMRGTDNISATKQIRVGVDTLAHYWRTAYKYLKNRLGTVPVDDLAHIADLYYVAGPGATNKRLDKLSIPNWVTIKTSYPAWNALPHPNKIFTNPMPWNLTAINNWLEKDSDGIKMIADPKTGFILGIILLMAVYWCMKKG